jgi:uncharacterized protein (TIGR03067 family)
MNDRTSFLSLIGSMAIAISIVSPSYGCNQSPSVEQKILGTWQATVEGVRGTVVFAPDGQLFTLGRDSTAFAMKYQLNTQTKPMQLDLNDGREKMQAIFEFTGDNKLRIEVEGVGTGNTRPKSFSSEAIVFEKVSDSTSLPPNTRVQTFEDIYPDESSKNNIIAINKAQTIYRAKNSTFGGLSIINNPKDASGIDNNYSYKLVVVETEKTMAIGIPKKDGLKSYIGIVYRYKNSQGQSIMSSVACESKEPTKTIPTFQLEAIPKAPPTCPSGYSEVKL